MAERRKVLELFEKNKELIDKKVSSGIENYRKGNAKIRLIDVNGKPVKDAKIKYTQKSHEFKFGANIFMLNELETEEKNESYKKHFSELFNIATLPFYWNTLEPEKGKPRYEKDSEKIYRRPAIDLCIEFCEKHGIEPREHALAYEHFFPDWLIDKSTGEVKSELERRYFEISERYADKIPTIEVTNEMIWENGTTSFYSDPDYVYWCFKTAEKYFRDNELCINEATNTVWGENAKNTDTYYSYVRSAMLKGARIDAIGMQYHLFFDKEAEYEKTRKLLDPINLYNTMDLYSEFSKPLQITEITVPSYSWEKEDEEIQAEIIEQLYSIWFSHPKVSQIIYWNLVDGYAHVWENDPVKIKRTQGDMTVGENYYHGGLLRFDLTPKPAYNKIKELITKKWHTEGETFTDNNGYAEFKGFFGEYELLINGEKEQIAKNIKLSSKESSDKTVVV